MHTAIDSTPAATATARVPRQPSPEAGPPAQQPQGQPTDAQESPAPPPARTKVRLTVDLTPTLHGDLKSWTAFAANELDLSGVAAADVVRILVRRLTMTRRDPDYDETLTPHLLEAVLHDLQNPKD